MIGMWNEMDTWALVAVVVVILNVVPVFAPPTWAVLAFFHLQFGLAVVPLALLGTCSAMTGRGLLALASRRYGTRFVPRRWQANIQTLVEAIGKHKLASLSALGLFALGPVPSDQLFIAAGIARAPLAPVLAVFGAGRLVAYFFWVSAAGTASASLEELLKPKFGGGIAIAAQILSLIVLIVVMQINWKRVLRRHRRKRDASPREAEPVSPAASNHHITSR